jgi:hypothetical protein
MTVLRFFLFAGLLLSAPARGLAQFHDETKDLRKPADEKSAGSQVDDAWRARLKELGKGPVYRAEILFRGGDDRLYLAETLFSPDLPQPRMMGFGLNEKADAVPPPDPGYQRVQEAVREKLIDEPASFPLAWSFRYYGVSLRDIGTAHHGDVATRLNIPGESGGIAYTLYSGAFRVERLSPEQVAAARPLRRDPKYFRDRTAAIRKELLTTHREAWANSQHGKVEVARLFREPHLIADVRRILTDWIERDPAAVAGKGWPGDASEALAHLGRAADFDVFHRLVRRHPAHARFVITPTLHLVQRVGGHDAGPLISDLLKLKDPFTTGSESAKLLRQLAPDVPEPTYGDYTVMTVAEKLGRKPTDFGMKLAPELLKVSAQSHSEDWVFATAADRRAGIAAALKWATEYQPPR